MTRNFHFVLTAGLLLAACGNDPIDEGGAATDEAQAILAVKDYVAAELRDLHAAAVALQAAAPDPDADGWNAVDDATNVEQMRAAWKRARTSYERVEGAIAVLFPELDASTDERYDGFLESTEDDNLFDGEGVTGVHAIERILWADSIPEHVVAYESAEVDGYTPAAFPANEQEATDFEGGLVQRLIDDTAKMATDFEPLALDSAAAFRGVIGSLEEQLEKVSLAATGADESRYAQYTLGDMRANLEGGREIYAAFRPWLSSLEHGDEVDAQILAGFERVAAGYEAIDGDAIPSPPDTWNETEPSEADRDTPYGRIFTLLEAESDPEAEGSLVHGMLHAADLLGIAQLAE